MDKKTYKRRCRRLWAATEIWWADSHGFPVRMKAAKKPLTGNSIRRLLANGMYGTIGQYRDNSIECLGWAFDYPKFNARRKYVVRIQEALYDPNGSSYAYIGRAYDE